MNTLIKYLLLITGILFYCFSSNGCSALLGEPIEKSDTQNAISSNSEFVVLGEVIAVQKEKGTIRIDAYDVGALYGKNYRDISEYFLKTHPRLILMDSAGNRAGIFNTTQTRVEWGLHPGDLRTIILYGFFDLENSRMSTYTTIGYKAGFDAEKEKYLSPLYHTTSSKPINEIRHHKDQKIMVFIPESRLVYGQGHNPRQDNFNPYYFQRDAWVVPSIPAFYIDKYEVTNREYWIFCQKTGHPLPPSWENGSFLQGEDEHPVTNISYRDAEKYAQWTNKRLPTEFEWELAARGSLNLLADDSGPGSIKKSPRNFPFGNEFDPMRCNTLESGRGHTIPVTEMQDESPFGIFGMCGNSREWTSSLYKPYKGHNFISNSDVSGNQFRVIRGGSYYQKSEYAHADSRDYGGFPDLLEDRSAGFRLVMDAD